MCQTGLTHFPLLLGKAPQIRASRIRREMLESLGPYNIADVLVFLPWGPAPWGPAVTPVYATLNSPRPTMHIPLDCAWNSYAQTNSFNGLRASSFGWNWLKLVSFWPSRAWRWAWRSGIKTSVGRFHSASRSLGTRRALAWIG